jgi:hypothetical protein
MSARIPAHQIHFLSLQTAIFCVQCELISTNNTPRCLACGSKAVFGLSRLLGGSIRNQSSAQLIEDDELNRIVRELLQTVPGENSGWETPTRSNLPARHHARACFGSTQGQYWQAQRSISNQQSE